MKDYEFISYTQYHNDKFVSASCKLRLLGRYVITYVQKTAKTGGMYWGMISTGVEKDDGSGKSWLNGFKDPLAEDDQIADFINSNVKRVTASQMPQIASIAEQTTSVSNGVADEQPLPF